MKHSLVALALSFSLLAHAGNDRGNGGDGVVLPSGEIVLYDFFERSIDAEERLVRRRKNAEKEWSYSMEVSIRRLRYQRLKGPLWEGANGKALVKDLTIILGHLGDSRPTLAKALLDELGNLRWVNAPVDLKPNPDTASSLAGVTLIGCARTEQDVVLYSPSCSGEKMSTANRAGLVIHELFYNYFRRRFPETDSSFAVRSFLSLLVGGHKPDAMVEFLTKAGMGDVLAKDNAIRELFFGGNHWYSSQIECAFEGEYARDIRLNLSGAGAVRGYLNRVKESGNQEDRNFVIGTTSAVMNNPNWLRDPSDFGAWLAMLPEFDLTTRTMTIEMLNDQDETTATLVVHYDGSKTADLKVVSGDIDETYPGRCSRVE